MSKQVSRRRGSAAQHANFTGSQGEITVDTTNYRLIVHDGSTAGGITGVKRTDVFTDGYPLLAGLDGQNKLETNVTSTILAFDADNTITVADTLAAGSISLVGQQPIRIRSNVSIDLLDIGNNKIISIDASGSHVRDQNGIQGLRVISGSVYAGSGSIPLKSTDTNGFFHIPVMTGNPVGQLPNKYPSHAPTVLAATGQNRLYLFNPTGAWWFVNLTST